MFFAKLIGVPFKKELQLKMYRGVCQGPALVPSLISLYVWEGISMGIDSPWTYVHGMWKIFSAEQTSQHAATGNRNRAPAFQGST